MNDLQIFDNGEFGQIRAIEIDGKPYFAASDIAEALGYSNPRKAISDHCKGVTKRDTPTNSGIQSINYIPEGDIYRLIVRSKLPSAERFESWVFDEVIPSIRQTGSYHVPQTYAEALRAYADAVEQKERLALENKALQPKAEFFDAVTDSKDAISMADVAKVLDLGMGRNKLFKFLRRKKVLMDGNIPYQEYIDRGYFRVIEQKYDKGYGEIDINLKTLVFQKGINYIRKLLREEGYGE
ncbi:MAG: phage antirepressor KilAC domain-containing protein [Clostridiales bacterium]|nr:phage antirepressor KilAC domain-containing protein [Clostridiales bacterium]MBQ1569759.1 phage antirepressor KilAC domain-containing protein [Clostridiales bacterium]